MALHGQPQFGIPAVHFLNHNILYNYYSVVVSNCLHQQHNINSIKEINPENIYLNVYIKITNTVVMNIYNVM